LIYMHTYICVRGYMYVRLCRLSRGLFSRFHLFVGLELFYRLNSLVISFNELNLIFGQIPSVPKEFPVDHLSPSEDLSCFANHLGWITCSFCFCPPCVRQFASQSFYSIKFSTSL